MEDSVPSLVEEYPTERQLIVVGPADQIDSEMQRATEIVRRRLHVEIEPEVLRRHPLSIVQRFLEIIKDDVLEGIPLGRKLRTVGRLLSCENPMVIASYGMPSVESAQLLVPELNRSEVVSAQRNFVIGHRETWGGSPWHGPDERPGEDDYWDQWGLVGENGIANEIASVLSEAQSGVVRVGVFDSSPFTKQGLKTLDWVNPDLNLTVWHPDVSHLSPDSPLPANAQSHPDHGLCVASLVHSVAPRSEIHLIRVLDEYVRGDIEALLAPLLHFICAAYIDWAGGAILGAVINLSLGVSPDSTQVLPEDMATLKELLELAYHLRFVVVASVGNDSYGLATPEPAQVPASYDWVIGVQATGVAGVRACFSNLGDVGAPGCGLVSLVTTPPPSSTGYDYCMGTSFAAPLVSGLAARMLHKWGGQTHPGQVDDRIKQKAHPSPDTTLSHGVVNVPDSLS
jgi:hypothetical protein